VPSKTAAALLTAAADLRDAVNRLRFPEPVAWVYNPLDYAWETHAAYLTRFGRGPKRVVFLGMNPGPFGMVQTGVPFGEVAAVRDWMKLTGNIRRPAKEHPKRPIEGLACRRSEVSGRRLWGLFAERFGTAEAFHADHFVVNYCPLAFLEAGGRNLTPDKLPAAAANALSAVCDAHLRRVLEMLQPEFAIGVGAYALEQLERVAGERPIKLGTILHPSPASPAANRGWAEQAQRQLKALGVW
jgi:single-strand selective monofunctional uracil DNA glycosylase